MYFIAWQSSGNILPPTSHMRVNLPLGSTIHHHWTVISICKYQQWAMKTHSSFHCWVSSCWYRIWIISWETSRPDLCNYSAAAPSTSIFQFISEEDAHTSESMLLVKASKLKCFCLHGSIRSATCHSDGSGVLGVTDLPLRYDLECDNLTKGRYNQVLIRDLVTRIQHYECVMDDLIYKSCV